MAEMPSGGAGGLASAGAGGSGAGKEAAASAGAASGASPFVDLTQMRELQHDRRDMAHSQQPKQGAAETSKGGLEGAPQDTPGGLGDKVQPDAAPALGAGGTSAAAPDPGDANGLAEKGGGLGKLAGAAAAVPAAGVAGQALVLMMFINYLKGMMMSMAAVATNLWSMALGVLLAAGKAAVGAIMGVGSMISGAVGGAVSAATAGAASAVAAAAVTVAVVVGGVTAASGANLAMKDGMIDCGVSATTALASIDGSEGSVDAKTLANAKTIYSVLSAWGMPDENVAGIIGNWDAESGVDPTSVQGYFDSPQLLSEEKRTAATNADNGIGLGQWTFGRNSNLRAYASTQGAEWSTLEMQLGFMLSAAEGSDADIVKGMIETSVGTPNDAALYFHDKWERSADTASMAARRGEKATKWMGMFSGWDKNQELADSILAQSGTTVTGANSSRAQAVRADCLGVGQASLTTDEGGLTLDKATELMALYRAEGEDFLVSRYGAGGPGDCGYGKSDNCVGFSTYFVNKYTSFQQYARGDGKDTAGSMASMMGKVVSNTPTAYSVASGGSGFGHTFVVLGIQGDQAVIGEAICGSNHTKTRARLWPLSDLSDGSWEFVDVSDIMVSETAPA